MDILLLWEICTDHFYMVLNQYTLILVDKPEHMCYNQNAAGNVYILPRVGFSVVLKKLNWTIRSSNISKNSRKIGTLAFALG